MVATVQPAPPIASPAREPPGYEREGASKMVLAIGVFDVASAPSSVAKPRYIVHAEPACLLANVSVRLAANRDAKPLHPLVE